MKTRLLATVFVTVMVGLSACGGNKKPDDPPKSSAKEITSFVVDKQAYTPTADGFTWEYIKSGPDTWATEPSWPVEPTITHTGVSISPAANQKQNFRAGAVTYTVTAEDGSTKTYKVSATRKAEL